MKKRTILGIFLLALSAYAADKYANYTTLASQERENTDYQVIVKDHSSPITILAIHGGRIERGTSELMNEMDEQFNKYAFEGLKETGNFDLHITSANFDEPKALDLVARSKDCLSLHGYIGKKGAKAAFCLGGQNEALAQKMANALQTLGEDYDVLFPCDAYPGKHESNIVNRCQNAGVQIEMNSALRDTLLQDKIFRKNVAQILSQILK